MFVFLFFANLASSQFIEKTPKALAEPLNESEPASSSPDTDEDLLITIPQGASLDEWAQALDLPHNSIYVNFQEDLDFKYSITQTPNVTFESNSKNLRFLNQQFKFNKSLTFKNVSLVFQEEKSSIASKRIRLLLDSDIVARSPTPSPVPVPSPSPTLEPSSSTQSQTSEPSSSTQSQTSEPSSSTPSQIPSRTPSQIPSQTSEPSSSTPEPTPSPAPEPTRSRTPSQIPEPTRSPTPEATPSPTPEPTPSPTPEPTPSPTPEPPSSTQSKTSESISSFDDSENSTATSERKTVRKLIGDFMFIHKETTDSLLQAEYVFFDYSTIQVLSFDSSSAFDISSIQVIGFESSLNDISAIILNDDGYIIRTTDEKESFLPIISGKSAAIAGFSDELTLIYNVSGDSSQVNLTLITSNEKDEQKTVKITYEGFDENTKKLIHFGDEGGSFDENSDNGESDDSDDLIAVYLGVCGGIFGLILIIIIIVIVVKRSGSETKHSSNSAVFDHTIQIEDSDGN